MLNGFSVWATRPPQQNSIWAQRLASAGARVITCPLLHIAPVTDAEGIQAIKNIVLELDTYSTLIFVSQNAVQYGLQWLDDYWPQLPAKQKYMAIGRKTAALLSTAVDNVIQPDGAMDTPALLAMDACQSVVGERIAIFRGRGGLPRLGDALTQRGATVHYCELYDRVRPVMDESTRQQLEQSMESGALMIPVFSGETFDNLIQVLQTIPAVIKTHMSKNITLIVPGERVAKQARAWVQKNALPIQVVRAKNASEEAMLAATAFAASVK